MNYSFEKLLLIYLVLLYALLYTCFSYQDSIKSEKKVKPIRFMREAPIIIGTGGGGGRSPGTQSYNYHVPNNNADEGYGGPIQPSIQPIYTPPTGNSNGHQGFGNTQQGHSGSNGYGGYSPPSLSMTAPSKGSYGTPSVTPAMQVMPNMAQYYTTNQYGNRDKGILMGYNYNPNSIRASSSYGRWNGEKDYPDQNQKYGEMMMKKGETPVNYSAVSLLGLLALMGMIQHVMTDMDSSTMKSGGGSGDSDGMGMGRPNRPGGGRPPGRPRIQRNLNFPKIYLPDELVSNISRKILPSFIAIAKTLSSNKWQSHGGCVAFYVRHIYNLLIKEFNVPKELARLSLRKSLKIIGKKIGLHRLLQFLNISKSLKQSSSTQCLKI